METKEIEKRINEFLSSLEDLKNKLEIDDKKKRMEELNKISSSLDFWNDIESTKPVLEEQKRLGTIINKYDNLFDSVTTLNEMLELELEEGDLESLTSEIEELDLKINDLKLATFLNGEYDSSNAYVEIHSGAGGTESNDWANMLLRMYTRYFDKNDYKYEIISKNDGEEVGIKGAVLLVK